MFAEAFGEGLSWREKGKGKLVLPTATKGGGKYLMKSHSAAAAAAAVAVAVGAAVEAMRLDFACVPTYHCCTHSAFVVRLSLSLCPPPPPARFIAPDEKKCRRACRRFVWNLETGAAGPALAKPAGRERTGREKRIQSPLFFALKHRLQAGLFPRKKKSAPFEAARRRIHNVAKQKGLVCCVSESIGLRVKR